MTRTGEVNTGFAGSVGLWLIIAALVYAKRKSR